MTGPKSNPAEPTYALGAASRLTGLTPSLLRAWERRYGAVQPLRTPGGTRRYRAADLERLQLLKAAVDTGHRIGQLARLDAAELERLVTPSEASPRPRLDEILGALDSLDGAAAQRLLSLQLSALGAVGFARELALPLLREIGERWATQRMAIASEHMATGVVRSMLGSALQPTPTSLRGPRIVFATPSGERHEIGLQMAALTALGAGANPVYLGADLPVEEVLGAADRTGAAAVALGLVSLPAVQAARAVNALRGGLPLQVHVWLGGAGARDVELADGVERIESLETLEQRVARLVFEAPGPR
ncbi:MAG TPA: MerR family transcriptional regulator [Myxococcota bacterium]|nr:MerR family transcriptional regulator [Myxococcota bacterium]